MADRLFSALIPRVAPFAPGAPQPLLIQQIRAAARRVCERTGIWRYTQPTFSLLPGVHEYSYDKPADTEVHILFAAVVNDEKLHKRTLEEAIDEFPEWADLYSGESVATLWSETATGVFDETVYDESLFAEGSVFVLPDAVIADSSSPSIVCHLTPDKYVVLPQPDDGGYVMRMFYALKPTISADGMDEHVLNDIEETVVHGALQELLSMPDTNWSDKSLATYHAKQFLFFVTERRARANLSTNRGPMTAKAGAYGW